jgi:hypothetical protein
MLALSGGTMRIALLIVGVLLLSLAVSPSAHAATVNATQGQVLLNLGQGYKQVAGSSEAGPGAIVVANPGGSAQVVYSDGCSITVTPGMVYTIAPQSPCGSGGPAFGGGGFEMNTTTMVALGALAGGGIAAAIIFSTGSSSKKPASP